jgi:hypothetical protein
MIRVDFPEGAVVHPAMITDTRITTTSARYVYFIDEVTSFT